MRIQPTTLLLLLLGMLAHCSSHKPGTTRGDELAYLFSRASSVQVLSYTNRMYEPPQIEGEEKTVMPVEPAFLVVGDLNIIENTVQDRVLLNRAHRDSLLRLLKTDMCEIDGTAICYDPRHAIVFFDSNDQAFGYVEICFACTNYETSGNFEFDFCYEKSEALKSLFQSFGIRYFGVGEL